MRITADLHVHSKYSRAVSRDMNLEHMATWAEKKGIHLVGTSDFTHPAWFAEMRSKLVADGSGAYRLKHSPSPIRFIPTTEISCMYRQDGRGRRIHVVIIAPNFDVVENINARLSWQGKLGSDGRPILGMSAKDLAATVFEASEDCIVIPAHIWTPWFSLFGSKSGFDSLEECFGDLADRIPAIETGLSSDPPMNWRLSQLDAKQIVSFSDAHSGSNLGRESTVFELDEPGFPSLARSLRSPDGNNRIASTIEFFPEEGKYHWDGHRACAIRWSPAETEANDALCPTCGKRVTVGVLSRVEDLADRPEGFLPEHRPPFRRLVPLAEIIGEALGIGKATKAVGREYDSLLNAFGSELTVLLDVPIDELHTAAPPRIAEGIERVRAGRLTILAGYDGEFGTVRVFEDSETAPNDHGQAPFR